VDGSIIDRCIQQGLGCYSFYISNMYHILYVKFVRPPVTVKIKVLAGTEVANVQ